MYSEAIKLVLGLGMGGSLGSTCQGKGQQTTEKCQGEREGEIIEMKKAPLLRRAALKTELEHNQKLWSLVPVNKQCCLLKSIIRFLE